MFHKRSKFVSFAFAIAVTLAVVAAQYAVARTGNFPLLFLFPAAVVTATWFGGTWPGFVSLLISEVSGFLLLDSNPGSSSLVSTFSRFAAYAATMVLVWGLTSAVKSSQEQLHRMNLRFGGVVQISEDAIISVDEKQRITLFNPGAENIFGYKQNEIIGRSLDVLIPERYRKRHSVDVKGFQQAPDTLRPMGQRSTIYGMRKDGTEFPAEASISKFEAEGKKILTVRLRDVSEQKMAERGLRQLAAIVESSDDAIVGETVDGVISTWNAGAEKIYGYTASEMIGKRASVLLPPDRADEVWTNIERAKNGDGFRTETVRLRKDGHLISLSLSVSPTKDASGHVIGISTIGRDVSERKKLEEQLRQSQKMEAVGRLAGGIAHDFNNLLSIIVGYTYVLQSSLPDNDSLKNSAQQVMSAAEKASSLTRQLLAFSRRQVLQPEIIDVNHILEGMGKMLPRLIGEDIDIRVVRSAEIGHIKADPSQIEQVIMNLVVNARDAMPDGGNLTLETAPIRFTTEDAAQHSVKPGDYVMLAVSDTGTGMDSQTRAHIFEPFFTTKEAGRGTGLGLATVYGIVSQSNGYIWVYSEPGMGTTFKIYFPVTAATAEDRRISHRPQLSLTGAETILLVEDEPDLRELMHQVLTKQGYKVLDASTGEEAASLAATVTCSIDLLLTDVVMPKMGGQQLSEIVRSQCPEVRVIFMSGYTNNALMHSGSLNPSMSFLQKPFTPDVLLRKVREVLNARADERSERKAV